MWIQTGKLFFSRLSLLHLFRIEFCTLRLVRNQPVVRWTSCSGTNLLNKNTWQKKSLHSLARNSEGGTEEQEVKNNGSALWNPCQDISLIQTLHFADQFWTSLSTSGATLFTAPLVRRRHAARQDDSWESVSDLQVVGKTVKGTMCITLKVISFIPPHFHEMLCLNVLVLSVYF